MTAVHDVAQSVAPGQWAQVPAPAGLSQALFDWGSGDTRGYFDKAAHDPVRDLVRFIGKAHYGDQRWHQFDLGAHSFVNLPDPPWDDGGDGPTSYLGHGYQHNTIDPATGDMYYWLSRMYVVHKLDASAYAVATTPEERAAAWSQITGYNRTSQQASGGLEWLPTIGTQGGLVLFQGRAVSIWDKATGVWTEVARAQFAGLTYHGVAVRRGARVTVGGGNKTRRLWDVDGAGGVTEIATCPVAVGIYASVTTACPVSADMLVFSPGNALSVLSGASWSQVVHTGPNIGADVKRVWAVPIASLGVVMVVLRDLGVWLYRHA